MEQLAYYRVLTTIFRVSYDVPKEIENKLYSELHHLWTTKTAKKNEPCEKLASPTSNERETVSLLFDVGETNAGQEKRGFTLNTAWFYRVDVLTDVHDQNVYLSRQCAVSLTNNKLATSYLLSYVSRRRVQFN